MPDPKYFQYQTARNVLYDPFQDNMYYIYRSIQGSEHVKKLDTTFFSYHFFRNFFDEKTGITLDRTANSLADTIKSDNDVHDKHIDKIAKSCKNLEEWHLCYNGAFPVNHFKKLIKANPENLCLFSINYLSSLRLNTPAQDQLSLFANIYDINGEIDYQSPLVKTLETLYWEDDDEFEETLPTFYQDAISKKATTDEFSFAIKLLSNSFRKRQKPYSEQIQILNQFFNHLPENVNEQTIIDMQTIITNELVRIINDAAVECYVDEDNHSSKADGIAFTLAYHLLGGREPQIPLANALSELSDNHDQDNTTVWQSIYHSLEQYGLETVLDRNSIDFTYRRIDPNTTIRVHPWLNNGSIQFIRQQTQDHLEDQPFIITKSENNPESITGIYNAMDYLKGGEDNEDKNLINHESFDNQKHSHSISHSLFFHLFLNSVSFNSLTPSIKSKALEAYKKHSLNTIQTISRYLAKWEHLVAQLYQFDQFAKFDHIDSNDMLGTSFNQSARELAQAVITQFEEDQLIPDVNFLGRLKERISSIRSSILELNSKFNTIDDQQIRQALIGHAHGQVIKTTQQLQSENSKELMLNQLLDSFNSISNNIDAIERLRRHKIDKLGTHAGLPLTSALPAQSATNDQVDESSWYELINNISNHPDHLKRKHSWLDKKLDAKPIIVKLCQTVTAQLNAGWTTFDVNDYLQGKLTNDNNHLTTLSAYSDEPIEGLSSLWNVFIKVIANEICNDIEQTQCEELIKACGELFETIQNKTNQQLNDIKRILRHMPITENSHNNVTIEAHDIRRVKEQISNLSDRNELNDNHSQSDNRQYPFWQNSNDHDNQPNVDNDSENENDFEQAIDHPLSANNQTNQTEISHHPYQFQTNNRPTQSAHHQQTGTHATNHNRQSNQQPGWLASIFNGLGMR